MVESNVKANTIEQGMENSPQRDDRSHNRAGEYRQIICPYPNLQIAKLCCSFMKHI